MSTDHSGNETATMKYKQVDFVQLVTGTTCPYRRRDQ